MQVFGAWAQNTVKRYTVGGDPALGFSAAYLGAIVYAHFNCLRTFGMAQTSVKPNMDWPAFKERLLECGRRWGKLQSRKPTWAIYSPNCMSGSGMPPIQEGDYLDRFPVHFRSVMESDAFREVVSLLQIGISTDEQAQTMGIAMATLRKLVPGMLGDYHYKMLWDLTVVANWFPPRLVRNYPVCKKGGTAIGLRNIFKASRDPSPAVLSRMLDTLTDIAAERARSWDVSDHAGTVGAALCWMKRIDTAASSASHASRYAETTATWESELKQLAEAGLRYWWK